MGLIAANIKTHATLVGGELLKHKTMSQLFDYIQTLTGHKCTGKQIGEIKEIVRDMDRPEGWMCPVLPKDIPINYKWIAMDYDNDWYAYESKPEKGLYFYYNDSDSILVAVNYKQDINWKETLKEIPR